MSESEKTEQAAPEQEQTDAETLPEAEPDESALEGHVSTATDLPEGAKIDPLTDQRPEAVQEQERHSE